MKTVFEAAAWVDRQLQLLEFDYAFIGGIAVQVWGENRVTQDVDLTLLVPFGDEEIVLRQLVDLFPTRSENAVEFALLNRVLLCETPNRIGIDIGIGGFSFEEKWIRGAQRLQVIRGLKLPIVSAESLVVMKMFAGRPRDIDDVRGILIKQWESLDIDMVVTELSQMSLMLETSGLVEKFDSLRNDVAELLGEID